jgi:cystathionine beta-lyase
MTNFDEKINRKNTNCTKYDGLKKQFGVHSSIIIPAWIADMDFATPTHIQNAMKKKIDQRIFGYEVESDGFYKSIIKWQKNHNINLKKENIQFTSGVVPALNAAIRAYSNVGDEVIIQTPVYPPFHSVVATNNRKLIENKLVNKNNKYSIDFKGLKEQINKKTKILILCSPHNPVGRVWSKKELIKLHEICSKNNIKVISDEIHSDLVFKKFTSYATIDKKCLVLNAPSKTFNVAGFNTSYAFSRKKKTIEAFQDEANTSKITSLNTMSNTLIENCYNNEGKIWLKELLSYIQENTKVVEKYFKDNSSKIKVTKNESTYLIWLDFRDTKLKHNDIKNRLLNNAQVALNDGITFSKECECFFRLNITLPKKELKLILKRIHKEFA